MIISVAMPATKNPPRNNHGSARFVPSHLGFLCARSYVWVDRRPVGMIVVGGVTPAAWPPEPEFVEQVADEVGVPAPDLLARVDETYDLDLDAQRRILQLLPQFGDLVSQLATARSQLLDKLDAIAALASRATPPKDKAS